MNTLVPGIEKSSSVQIQDPDGRRAPRTTEEGSSRRTTDAPVEIETAQIESAIEQNGRRLVFGDRSIEFSFDEGDGRVIVKVKDATNGEVVRQIPPDQYLRFVARFKELMGVLFDEVV